MILNARKYSMDGKDLDRNEMRLLLLLSDNEIHKTSEIVEFLGRYSFTQIWRTIFSINKTFKKKIVRNKYGSGYFTTYRIDIDY